MEGFVHSVCELDSVGGFLEEMLGFDLCVPVVFFHFEFADIDAHCF